MEQTSLLTRLQKRRQVWLDNSSTLQQWAFILIVAFALWLLLLNSIPLEGEYSYVGYNSGDFFRDLSYYYRYYLGGQITGNLLDSNVPFGGAFICFSIATALVSLYSVIMTKTAFVSGIFWSCLSFVYHFIIFTPVAWCDGDIELPEPYLNRSVVFFIVSLAIWWTVYVVFKILLPHISKAQTEDTSETSYVFPRLSKKQSFGMIFHFLPFIYWPIIFLLYCKYGISAEQDLYLFIMMILQLLVPFIMIIYARKNIVKIHSVLEISSLSAMICSASTLVCCSPLFDSVHLGRGTTDWSGVMYQSYVFVIVIFQLIALLIISWIFAYKAGYTIASENPERPTYKRGPATLGFTLSGLGCFAAVMLLFAFSDFYNVSEYVGLILFLTMLFIPVAVNYTCRCIFRSQNPRKSALFGFLIIPITIIICVVNVLVSPDKLICCLLLCIGAVLFLIHLWIMYGLYAWAKRNREKKLAKLS